MDKIKFVYAAKDDVEKLIEIYSSPCLYHDRNEASWFVRSLVTITSNLLSQTQTLLVLYFGGETRKNITE